MLTVILRIKSIIARCPFINDVPVTMATEWVLLPPDSGLCVSGRYEPYAGLSTADDCGILHGCENGRCIRVSEGYTCDCYQGYELDMTSMTCIGGCRELWHTPAAPDQSDPELQ